MTRRVANLERQVADLIRRVERLEGRGGPREEPASAGPGPDGGSWLFVRRASWVPPDVAELFDGVIVAATAPGGRGQANRDSEWCAAIRARGVELVPFLWLPLVGQWERPLADVVRFSVDVGARGVCLNVEPRPSGAPGRWEGEHAEADMLASRARELCEAHGLELWFTSWARPSQRRSFPWEPFIRAAHVCIPQPYEVHGMSGPGYVADVLEQWRDLGARRIILGRGLHERDDDADAWRTVAQIREHRRSTPADMGEAWWPPGGRGDAGDLARRRDLAEAAVA